MLLEELPTISYDAPILRWKFLAAAVYQIYGLAVFALENFSFPMVRWWFGGRKSM